MDNIWYLILDDTVYLEGLYPNIYPGSVIDSGLNFSPVNIRKSSKIDKFAIQNFDNEYNMMSYYISAETIVTDTSAWVIDFGLYAYICPLGPPQWATPGIYTVGYTWLMIDDWSNDTILSSIVGCPPLVYTWEIKSILVEDEANVKYEMVKAEEIDNKYGSIDNLIMLQGSICLKCMLIKNYPKWDRSYQGLTSTEINHGSTTIHKK